MMKEKGQGKKTSKLFLKTGEDALALRQRLALNQSEFWSRVAISQSGGSRYESGRKVPRPVQLLLNIAYAPEKNVQALLGNLRVDLTPASRRRAA